MVEFETISDLAVGTTVLILGDNQGGLDFLTVDIR